MNAEERPKTSNVPTPSREEGAHARARETFPQAPVVLLVCGGILHAFAQSANYLGIIGDIWQEFLKALALVMVFAPALYALRRSFKIPAVRWLAISGVTCELLHLALDAADDIPWLNVYRVFSNEHAAHIIAQELFGASAIVLLLGCLYYFVVSNQTSEETLALERDHFRSLFEGVDDALFVHDVKGRILDCNEAACRRLGYSRSELLKLRTSDIDAAGFAEGFEERLRAQLAEGRFSGEGLHVRKDGTEIPVDVNTSVIDYGGERAILAVMRDISDRKQAEQALRESEERFRTLAENIPGVIYLCKSDERWTMLYLNDTVKELTGYPKEAFLKDETSFVDLYHPDDKDKVFDEVAQALEERRPYHLLYRIKHRSGEWRWVEEIGVGIYRDDELLLLEGFLADVSERIRSEEERRSLETQIQETQRLESLGVLAGGIAHDFNNLLMGILGNADLIVDDLPPLSPVRDCVDDIKAAGKRAADLCRQMLAYSGKGRFVVGAIDLNEVIREMASLLEAAMSRKAHVYYSLAEELPAVEADATQMRQVVMNLMTNASDAIEEKQSPATEENTIDIITGVTQCDAGYFNDARTGEDSAPGRCVFVEITDTGAGMERETQKHIFDPFFTTRFTGRGLGLSAVLGIVRGHHGALKMQSEPGKGSTFRLLFPATDRPAKPLHKKRHVQQAWRTSGTLLLVDDDKAVRTIGKRMLERVGFEVLSAADGREAVDVFRAHAQKIRCVVLDLTMPNMDGEQTFRELRGIRPDIPIIMSSGYNQQEVTNRFTKGNLAGFLHKPYGITALLTAVRRVVEPED